jgi:hypothetical protein
MAMAKAGGPDMAPPLPPHTHTQIEKLPREQVEKELGKLGVAASTIEGEEQGRRLD